MLQLEVLVRELLSINAFSSGSVSSREVSSLAHKVRDDSVEGGSLEVQRLPRAPGALLAGAETTEVLGSLGNDVGTKLHDDAAGGGAADGHVEENLGVGHDVWFLVWFLKDGNPNYMFLLTL